MGCDAKADNPDAPRMLLQVDIRRTRRTIQLLTKNAIESLLVQLDPGTVQWANLGYWQAANAWTAIIDYEIRTGSTDYAGLAWTAFSRTASLKNDFNDDLLWQALACLRPSEAYPLDGHAHLRRAEAHYQFVCKNGLIRQEHLHATPTGHCHLPCKDANVTFQPIVRGHSMLGGVYWKNDRFDPHINAVSTGLLAVLAAELYERHEDTVYREQAAQCLTWMERHMLDDDSGLMFDHLDGRDGCLIDWRFTYNLALYTHAAAILGTHHATWYAKALQAARRAIETSVWNDHRGICVEGQGEALLNNDCIGFKAVLMRAITLILTRDIDAESRRRLNDYVAVQFYAIMQLASDDPEKPTRYGRNWQGPYEVSTQISQATSLDLLNAVLALPNDRFPERDLHGPVVVLRQP